MFLVYHRTNCGPPAQFGDRTAGFPEYLGQSVVRPPRLSPAFVRQILGRRAWGAAPLPPGFVSVLPRTGQSIAVSANRLSGERIARDKRANRHGSHPLPALDQGMLVTPPVFGPTSVRPRVSGSDGRRWQRRFRQSDCIAITGPGLSARPPFVGLSVRPRLTAADLGLRGRRYRQTDPRGALSGLSARTQGMFVGAKLALLSTEPRRSVVNFTVQGTRDGNFTVQ